MDTNRSVSGKSRCIFGTVMLIGVLIAPGHAVSADPGVSGVPSLLFLSTARDTAERKTEQRIISKISLTLDDFTVRVVTEGLDAFRTASLSQSLELLKQLDGVNEAVATVWIDQGPGLILLNLVALSTGQALVRIVEAEQSPEMPAVLALALQELLGQAYLFQQSPLPEEVRRRVQSVTRSAATARESRGERPDPPDMSGAHWMTLLSAGVRSGVASTEGPATRFGAHLGFGRQLQNGWFLLPEARLFLGPGQKDGSLFVSSLGAGMALGAGYRFRLKSFAVRPHVALAALWQRTDIGYPEYRIASFHWFNLTVDAQISLLFQVTPVMAIGLIPLMSLSTVKKYFHRLSDDRVILTQPRIEWGVMAAIEFRI